MGPRRRACPKGSGSLALGCVEQTQVDDVALVVPRAGSSTLSRARSKGWVRFETTAAPGLRFEVESGWPEFEVDFGESDNAHEAALDRRAVSWSKGCYLGQEVVCMQDMRGKVKRRVVPFELSAGELPAVGAEVSSASGESIGRVTSAVQTEGGRLLGLGMLKALSLRARQRRSGRRDRRPRARRSVSCVPERMTKTTAFARFSFR